MPSVPLVLSPALPSELLSYIIQHETYPTTLIICSSRAEFLSSLVTDIRGPGACQEDSEAPASIPPTRIPHSVASPLLSAPLYQIAIARHLHIVFVPTVSHLRAYLSVFSLADSKVPPPPTTTLSADAKKQPLLLVYGFLSLHRDTSEWSAQGLSSTAAALVEAARSSGLRAVAVDPPESSVCEQDNGEGVRKSGGAKRTNELLSVEVPVLGASVTRAGRDFDDAAWAGRKVALRRVLGRWFRYEERHWTAEDWGTDGTCQ